MTPLAVCLCTRPFHFHPSAHHGNELPTSSMNGNCGTSAVSHRTPTPSFSTSCNCGITTVIITACTCGTRETRPVDDEREHCVKKHRTSTRQRRAREEALPTASVSAAHEELASSSGGRPGRFPRSVPHECRRRCLRLCVVWVDQPCPRATGESPWSAGMSTTLKRTHRVLLIHTGHDAEDLGPDDKKREYSARCIWSAEQSGCRLLPACSL